MKLQIDYGYRTYSIEDSEGNVVGSVRFNPSDPGMAGRWSEAQKVIDKIVSDDPQTPAEIYEADRAIKAQLDYIFAAPVADVLFAGQSSISLLPDGSLLLEAVLDAVKPIVQQAQAQAQKASAERMAKHTAKYQNSDRGMAPEQP